MPCSYKFIDDSPYPRGHIGDVPAVRNPMHGATANVHGVSHSCHVSDVPLLLRVLQNSGIMQQTPPN